jgi:hypothetical protein
MDRPSPTLPKKVSPGGRKGDMGLTFHWANPRTTIATKGTRITIEKIIELKATISSPRMFMYANTAMSATPTSQRCQLFIGIHPSTYARVRAMYTAESTQEQVHDHQPHWKPQNSPIARRTQA